MSSGAQRQSKRRGGYTVHHHEAPVKSYDRTEQKVLLEYGDNNIYTKPDKVRTSGVYLSTLPPPRLVGCCHALKEIVPRPTGSCIY